MKKFEIVDLENLPKGARFYFVGARLKTVYEVTSAKPDEHHAISMTVIGTGVKMKASIYYSGHGFLAPSNRPKTKCVFLSLPQETKNGNYILNAPALDFF